MADIIKDFETQTSEELLRDFNSDDPPKGLLENRDPYMAPVPATVGIVDVIRNFSWYSGGSTQMQENAIRKTPQVFLVEREQLLSSLLSQALYYANSIPGIGSNGATQKKEAESFFKKMTSILSYAVNPGSAAADMMKKAGSVALDVLTAGDDTQLLIGNKLRSLIGIYLTKPTGFKYVFPYFENPPSIQNSWEGTAAENTPGFVEEGIDNSGKVFDGVAKSINLAQPGIFIQKAKSYKVNEQGQSVTVRFPLFNTVKRGNDTPYQQNYELLWLLIYQNKPFKTSFTRVKPPKLYTVTIPGMLSMPYAEISRLEVNFVGTTRNKTVRIGPHSFETPIPDAYEVTIEITSLLADYANTMLSDGFMTSVTDTRAAIGDLSRAGQTIL